MSDTFILAPTHTSFYTTPAMEKLILQNLSEKDKEYTTFLLEMTRENDQLVYLMYNAFPLTPGNEEISFKAWLHDILVMSKRLGTRIFRLARNIYEDVSKNYNTIMKIWEKVLDEKYNAIDDDHFENLVIKGVPYNELMKRIQIIKNISFILQKIESIVESPIDDTDDPNSYNTPEFVKVFKEISDIGFSMTNRTFTESRSQGYTSKVVEKKIKDLDYSKSNLPELVQHANNIASLATKKWLTSVTQKFVDYNNNLLYKEKKLLDDTSVDVYDKEEEIKKIRIKMSRLWWISNFVHMLHTLTTDQIKLILIIFRAAEKSVPLATDPENDGPGGKFF